MRGSVGQPEQAGQPLAMAREPDPSWSSASWRAADGQSLSSPWEAVRRPRPASRPKSRGCRRRGLPVASSSRGHRFPFGRGVVPGGRGSTSAMAGIGGGHLDGVLGTGQPDLLAAGTANRTPGRAQGGRIDGVGCCTMGANDVHGAHFHSDFVFHRSLSGCYIATVNEPETITAAKPFCPAEAQTSRLRAQGSGLASGSRPGSNSGPGFPATAYAERS